MCMSVLPVCRSVYCMHAWCLEARSGVDSLEPELWMIVNCLMAAGSLT